MSYKNNGKFGWGIIGIGRIANVFAECLMNTPEAEIVAAGSRSLEKSKEFCERFGGTPYGSYQEVFEDSEVDVVYIATPHMVHEENVIDAARSGKAILCEKPFSINIDQTKRMIAAAKENKVFLMEGLWSRFFPAWQYAKKLVDSGDLGNIEAIHSKTCWGKVDLPVSHRLLNIELSGGALLDAGIYSLAATTFIMGNRQILDWSSSMRIGPTGVDESTGIMIRFSGDSSAHISCGLYGWSFDSEIICEKGTIYIPRHRNPDTVIIRKRDQASPYIEGTEEKYVFPFEGEGFQFEAAAVQECLKKGLLECPMAPHSETVALSTICTDVRQKGGLIYPFE